MTDSAISPEAKVLLAYSAAIRLLARRDHSIFELSRKLRQRDHQEEAIAGAVEQLLDARYLNDERFAVLFAEQKMEKGFGPLSIRAKLYDRGIAKHYIQQALSELGVDWVEVAAALLQRRYDPQQLSGADQRDTARIARFLQSRGYCSSDAAKALRQARSLT